MKISLYFIREIDSWWKSYVATKGGQKLILNGFIYTKQITKPRNIMWRCVQRTINCKATLTTALVNDDPKLVIFKSTFSFQVPFFRSLFPPVPLFPIPTRVNTLPSVMAFPFFSLRFIYQHYHLLIIDACIPLIADTWFCEKQSGSDKHYIT